MSIGREAREAVSFWAAVGVALARQALAVVGRWP